MNFYIQKQWLGSFEEYTVYICIFLATHRKELLADSQTPLSFPKNHSLADSEVMFGVMLDLIWTVSYICFTKLTGTDPKLCNWLQHKPYLFHTLHYPFLNRQNLICSSAVHGQRRWLALSHWFFRVLQSITLFCWPCHPLTTFFSISISTQLPQEVEYRRMNREDTAKNQLKILELNMEMIFTLG